MDRQILELRMPREYMMRDPHWRQIISGMLILKSGASLVYSSFDTEPKFLSCFYSKYDPKNFASFNVSAVHIHLTNHLSLMHSRLDGRPVYKQIPKRACATYPGSLSSRSRSDQSGSVHHQPLLCGPGDVRGVSMTL